MEKTFLPDICKAHILLIIFSSGQILAFAYALGPSTLALTLTARMGLSSIFMLTIMLLTLAILCMSYPNLSRLSQRVASVLWISIAPMVTLIVSYVAVFTLYKLDKIEIFHASGLHWYIYFILQNIVISFLLSFLLWWYFYRQYTWQKHIEVHTRAKIQALQARIRPHFLFNSLNTIASLVSTHPTEAEEAVEDLADVFRAALSEANEVTIEQEINTVQHYLHLEKLRLGERLKVQWEISNLPQNALIPALTLQPLIENAIYHGIQPIPEGGLVEIRGQRMEKQIVFSIKNPITQHNKTHTGHGIAQDNIRQRLQLAYGKSAEMLIEFTEKYYNVIITLPYKKYQ